MTRNKKTGFVEADGDPNPDVNITLTKCFNDPSRQLCTSIFSSNIRNFQIKTALNEILPFGTDVELLKGGVIYEASLHEMLIQTKKTLAVEKYCEMALRLTTPGSFPPWLLSGVPIAYAGKCKVSNKMLKSYALEGPVTIEPVAVMKI